MEEKLTNRQKQAIETKQKIYKTAINLFAEYSYEKVTIQNVCKAANVSIGAFYHHYKSKSHILDEGYRFFDEDTEYSFNQKRPTSALESIYFLIKSQMDEVENVGAKAYSQFVKHHLTDEGKYVLDENRYFPNTVYKTIENAIEENIITGDAKKISDEILSITRGIAYDWCLHDGNFNLTQRALLATEMLLNHYKTK